MTSRVIVVHKVADYDEWKQHFDAAGCLRKAAGERSFEVLRAAEEPNLVVHAAEWNSLPAAKAFFESEEVEEIRRAAGVETPTFLYLTVADGGIAGD